MDDTYAQRPTTTATRNPGRVAYDRAAVHAVLDEAPLCHVGYLVEGRPTVLPLVHARAGDSLYLHCSSGSRLAQLSRPEGVEVCVTVTLLDGLVLARSAFRHSVNYRSVIAYGMAEEVTVESEKLAALAAVVDAVVRTRSEHTRPPSARELAATSVLRLALDEVSLKARTGGPNDEPGDLSGPYWAGVLPVTVVLGDPQPADDLVDDDLPAHVRDWTQAHSRP